MLHQDYLLPVPSNRLFTQAETSLHVLVPFRRNLHLIPLNPRKKHVKTFFHDITASKRDVSGHIHPTRLLKHFFEPISLLDMSLNQNKPKIPVYVRNRSYCIFRLSIQASRNKLPDPGFSGLRIACQPSFSAGKQKERVKRQ